MAQILPIKVTLAQLFPILVVTIQVSLSVLLALSLLVENNNKQFEIN